MGVYGSPQVGKFAQNNHKEPHSMKPWIILLAIICIFSAKYLYENRYSVIQAGLKNLFPLAQDSNDEHVVETSSQAPQEETPYYSKNNPGILNYTTGKFFLGDKELNTEILNALNDTLNKTSTGEINLIEEKNKVNSLYELMEKQKNQDISSEFKAYKEKANKTHQSAIELLENYVINNNVTSDTIQKIIIDYTESTHDVYDLMKTLFDENKIYYEEKIGIDGNRQIQYKYTSGFQ